MVAKCCIKECKSEKYAGCEMTFHGFPSDESLKTKWIEATGVSGNVKYKRICPLHFKNEDFTIKGKVIRLKQNVIPSFCMPPFRRYSDEDKMILKSSNMKYILKNLDYEKHGEADTHTDSSLQDCNESLCLDVLSGVTQTTKATDDIARCKCCLESNRLKSMWDEHYTGGLREVYGIMLTECFALHWSKPQNPKNCPDLICESCIARLKDAVGFKTEVLASEQLLSGQLEAVDVDKLKQEREDVDVNVQTEFLRYSTNDDDNEEVDIYDDNDCDADKNNDDGENIQRDKEFVIKTEPHLTSTMLTSSKKETSRSRQTALVLRKRKQSAMTLDEIDNMPTNISNVLKNEGESMHKRKSFNKREIADFDNLSDSLSKSIETVQSNKMSEAMAAIAYNVPQELIDKELSKVPGVNEWKDSKETKNNIRNGVLFVDLQKIIDNEMEESKKAVHEVKEEISKKTRIKVKEKDLRDGVKKPNENRLAEMKKQANNIAIILECSNATPIRRHGGIGYGCCFCNEEFPDAADLKQHTIKQHDMKTKRNYAKGKRPSAYLVKLDITGLKCSLCGQAIDSLEQLYDHLIEIHKKLLYRNAKNYIIPFKFDEEELRCLFCEFICNSFKGLLEHMSVHYRNHICEICDAGFLTKNNLFNHAGRHKKGTFKCDFCTKVFDTSSKKAGHQRLVHSSTNGVNRCGYCGEMFGTYRRKEKHLITEHGITLKKLKCKACDKTFETQTALRIHTKRDHLIERRFKCSVCDKRCFTNVQLNQHILKHTGVKKFQCTICLKAYGRKSTLREHMRIHENDRRFKCELCAMAFVQKCSWRGHMLSKHGQQV